MLRFDTREFFAEVSSIWSQPSLERRNYLGQQTAFRVLSFALANNILNAAN
jgi:hypothetical protein